MVNELIERILDLVPIVERESPFPKGATFHEIEALCRAAREFHLDKDFPFLRMDSYDRKGGPIGFSGMPTAKSG